MFIRFNFFPSFKYFFKTASCQAFTLIEVVLGMSILSVVLMSMTALTISSIRSNQANLHQLTAYYLAQEGIEGFRNVRDSNWLQNQAYNGGEAFWGVSLAEDGFYTLNYHLKTSSLSPSPWDLLYYGEDEDAARINGLMDDVLFSRYFEVRYPESGEDWFDVSAIVVWEERGRAQELRVSGTLSDWREGPI